MSVRTSEAGPGVTEAKQIAEHTTAREYFLSQQEKMLDDWAEKANQLFQYFIFHLGLREKCSKVSMSASLRNWSINTLMSMRNCTIKAVKNLKHIASSIAR